MYLRDKGIDYSQYSTRCGVVDLHDSNNNSKKTYEAGIKVLKCCIAMHNKKHMDATISFPYYQILNPHRISDSIYKLSTESIMGSVAASLLRVNQVRLYQTALFHKDGNTINTGTDWHQDLNMIPLDTGSAGYLTFWCPLNPISRSQNDSLLVFAAGSHRDKTYNHWYLRMSRIA